MRMDKGLEFVSVQLAGWAEQHGVAFEFIQPGKPAHNSYVERFNRTFRDEALNFYLFSRLSEVRTIVDAWMQKYDEQRPHESWGNLTPEEFALKHARGSSFELHEQGRPYAAPGTTVPERYPPLCLASLLGPVCAYRRLEKMKYFCSVEIWL